MSGSPYPLPNLHDRELAPFWAGAAAGTLLLQTCTACGYRNWPPRTRCPECLSEGLEWRPGSGRGRIWSVAVYDRALDPRFTDDVPYAVVLVELAEGPAMIGRYVGDPSTAAPDVEVSAVFTQIGDGVQRVDWMADEAQAITYSGRRGSYGDAVAPRGR